jgi:hypothetical protein
MVTRPTGFKVCQRSKRLLLLPANWIDFLVKRHLRVKILIIFHSTDSRKTDVSPKNANRMKAYCSK